MSSQDLHDLIVAKHTDGTDYRRGYSGELHKDLELGGTKTIGKENH